MPITPPPPPSAPPSPPLGDVPPPVAAPSADPEQAAARRRRAAALLSALGAALVLIAAATFISLRWGEMALLAKSGVLAGLAFGCIGGGMALRRRAPGTAAALVHLGAFTAALDAGAIATYADWSFGWIAAVGGVTGLATTALLPLVLSGLDVDDRYLRSPVMEAGRVLAIAAIGLAVANTTPLAATLVIAATAMTTAAAQRREATGLALVAGLGPVIRSIGSYAEPGSLLHWLAAMTAAPATATVAVAVVAVMAIVALHRGPFWSAAAVVVAAVATPAAVEVFGQHQDGALLTAAAAVVGFRILAKVAGKTGWLPLIDAGALTTALTAIGTGAFRFVEMLVWDQEGQALDVGLAATAGLLATGWLLSDLFDDEGVAPSRLWHGASGPIATVGLVSAVVVGATSTMQFDRAGVVVGISALALGLTRRKGAEVVLRSGMPLAAILLLGAPVPALITVIGGALVSQARAHRDLADGATPARASLTQLAGLAGLVIGSLATVNVWHDEPGNAVLAAMAIGAALVAIGIDSSRLSVPDLRMPPRLLLPVVLAPVWFDLGLAGSVAVATAIVLLADRMAFGTKPSEWLAPMHLTAGMWLIANQPWWQVERITAADWWLFGPSVLVGVFGWQELQRGRSSWNGFGPAFGIVGTMAILDRLDGAGGWHGAVAGAIGLAGVLVGVGRRWSSPTIIGAALLLIATVVEVGGVVPRIPVWALLTLGGAVLLGVGWSLERSAGDGPMASLRSTWSEFR